MVLSHYFKKQVLKGNGKKKFDLKLNEDGISGTFKADLVITIEPLFGGKTHIRMNLVDGGGKHIAQYVDWIYNPELCDKLTVKDMTIVHKFEVGCC